MPFAAGQGWIMHGYGPDPEGQGRHNAGGNVYSLDFCQYAQGSECRQGAVGDFVLAPTNLIYEQSIDLDLPTLNYHFFEVASDGATKLCMALAHFEIAIPGGMQQGQLILQGTVLGQLVDYAPSSPHIHMGIWTVPAAMPCAGEYDARTEVSFDGPYRIDSQGFATDVGHDHSNSVVTSTNVPADIDGDGDLTILDYNWLLSCTPPADSCSDDEADRADLNWDGRVDELDFAMMEQAFAAWEDR